MEDVYLNGKLLLLANASYKEVNALLGQPDSIKHNTAGCGGYFDVEDDLAYYQGVVYEKNKDTMGISHIDFTIGKKTFVQFGKIKLTAATVITDVTDNFKISKASYAKEIDDYDLGKKVQIISLDVTPEPNDYEKWYLIFHKGKLVRLELWHAC